MTPPLLEPLSLPEIDDPLEQAAPVLAEERFARAFLGGIWYLVAFVFGWTWRVLVAGLLGQNFFSSILVVGFLNRWTQGRVLHGLWKKTERPPGETFAAFSARLGPDAPVRRPRWILRDWFDRQHIQQELNEPTVDREPVGAVRMGLRSVLMPFRSLWLNFKLGLLAVFCTFLLTGWGCLLMQSGWDLGWVNSFNKGYEQATVGGITSLVGVVLFLVAMSYVPMAQVHFAVTGDYRSFFDFRFVSQLIRARYLAYVVLTALTVAFSFPIFIMKLLPGRFDDFPGAWGEAWANASDQEVARALTTYYFWCNVLLFLMLLITRGLAASIYRSALLKVLRRGRVTPAELHPVLRHWFDALGGLPAVQPGREGAWLVVATGFRGTLRLSLAFLVLPALWFAFIALVYVGEFLQVHPHIGFLNQPQLQLPAFDYVPSALGKNNGWDGLPDRVLPPDAPDGK